MKGGKISYNVGSWKVDGWVGGTCLPRLKKAELSICSRESKEQAPSCCRTWRGLCDHGTRYFWEKKWRHIPRQEATFQKCLGSRWLCLFLSLFLHLSKVYNIVPRKGKKWPLSWTWYCWELSPRIGSENKSTLKTQQPESEFLSYLVKKMTWLWVPVIPALEGKGKPVLRVHGESQPSPRF